MSPPALRALDRPIWDVARRLGTFTRLELAEAAGVTKERVVYLMLRLERDGVVEIEGVAEKMRRRYRVVQPDAYATGIVLPQAASATPEGNLWTAMRGLGQFGPRDLAAHAGTDEVPVTEAMAAAYCRLLMRAGYLRATRKAVPGRLEPIYRLLKNTGPRPPREKRLAGLLDENTGEFILPAGAAR